MKRLTRILLFLAVAAAAWWLYRQGRLTVPAPLRDIAERAAETFKEKVQEASGEISAPPPLRAKIESPSARLTQSGALTWTNAHRAEAGLKPLALNAELNAAAKAKLDDLFANQYFAHESPSGDGPADLAEAAGYAYLSVGENLALGNFADDKTLVQAWMNSPGHRANILEPKFTDIGIAVGKGVFEGRTTWLAVQEFGRPRSACPQPSASLKAQIEADEAQLKVLTAEADAKRAELEAMKKPRTREQTDAYNAKVDAYNALVAEINALIAKIQGEVTVYNGQAQAFNACAQGG
jgi:uncharacterized protein YkwD